MLQLSANWLSMIYATDGNQLLAAITVPFMTSPLSFLPELRNTGSFHAVSGAIAQRTNGLVKLEARI
jgi:hypothetical protein